MFTRQHYKAIAEIIEYATNEDPANACYGCRYPQTVIATCLADYFAKDNSRFDREKFLEACGL